MRTINEAVWSRAFINDLPDSSFLLILPGGSPDEESKTTPRTLRKFPVKGQTGKVDPPHVRNALTRIPQANITESQKNRAIRKAKRLARSVGIEVADEAEKMNMPDKITEITEWTEGLKTDRDTGVIRDVPLLGRTSKNRRRYSEAAMRDAVRLFEGSQVFANHPTGPDMGRDIRDLVGHVEDVRFDGDKVRSNLRILEHHRPWAMPIAEADKPGAGMSWVGMAKTIIADDGWADVESISGVQSVDMVVGPATVTNFSESEGVPEETDMSEHFQEMLATATENLTETKAALISVTEERDKLKDANDALTTEVESFKRQDGFDKAISAAGIDPKTIEPVLVEAIMAMDADKQKTALAALKKAATTETVTSDPASGDTPSGDGSTEAPTRESVVAEMTY